MALYRGVVKEISAVHRFSWSRRTNSGGHVGRSAKTVLWAEVQMTNGDCVSVWIDSWDGTHARSEYQEKEMEQHYSEILGTEVFFAKSRRREVGFVRRPHE